MPLSVVPGIASRVVWNGIDPNGESVIYTLELGGAEEDLTPFRWSASEGLVELYPRIGLPQAEDGARDTAIVQVERGGNALLGVTGLNAAVLRGFHWTIEDGLSLLDFVPSQMNRDGNLVLGLLDGAVVRWTTATGTVELQPQVPADAGVSGVYARMSAAGDVVMAALDGQRVFRWSEATGLVRIPAPPGASRDAPLRARQLSSDGAVIVGNIEDRFGSGRPFVWNDGIGTRFLLGSPMETAEEYVTELLSADGQTVVGGIYDPGQPPGRVFRWTRETGVTEVATGPLVGAHFVNSRGDVIVGGIASKDGRFQSSFRWTAAGGLQNLGPLQVGGVLFDGSVLFAVQEDRLVVLKFDDALGSEPLPLERARTFMPSGWSWVPFDVAVSANGRLLVGTADNPNGQLQAWALRLRDVCP